MSSRRRRLLLVVVVALLLGLVLTRALRRPLTERLFAHVVEENMTRDRVAELGDGLHVFLCGTGTPLPDPTRAGPCTVVLAGDAMVMIDAGTGGVRVAQLMGIPMQSLDALLLTHLHSDHIDGLGEVLLQAWVNGTRSTPLPVIGPTGTAAVVDGFDAAYAIDMGYRTAHHGPDVAPPAGAGGEAREFVTPSVGREQLVLEQDGLRVTAFKVEHDPVHDAVGYRFDYRGRSVVVSGDTDESPELVRVARGVDLLVHEALQPTLTEVMRDAAQRSGRDGVARILVDILDYHATPEEAARAARTADAGALVFHHTIPPLPSRRLDRLFLGDAGREYDGPMVVGRDGMVFTLPLDGGPMVERSLL